MNKEERSVYYKAWYRKNGRKRYAPSEQEEERNRERSRQRSERLREDPEYMQAQAAYYRAWYAKNGRKRSSNYQDVIIAWGKAHPDAIKAGQQVKEAIKKGLLVRLPNCIRCGRQSKVHAHHEDYNKPFEVLWLCASCHKRIHQNN